MTDAHNDPGGVDDKPSEPTTEAGKALLFRLVHNGIGPHENEPWLEARIIAIEQEARAKSEEQEGG